MNLQGRRTDRVAHREARDGQTVPIPDRMEDTFFLTRKKEPGIPAKSKCLRVMVESVATEQETKLGRAAVAGFAHNIRNR
jgi:hypothetical protein